MKRHSYLRLMLCAALALVVAGAVRAQDTPVATDAEKAFQQFKETSKPAGQPAPDAPMDEQKKWWGDFFQNTLKEADAFLKSYPKSENANDVRLSKVGALRSLAMIEDKAAYATEARTVLNDILGNQPTGSVAFRAYSQLLTMPETSIEDAAKYMATIKEKHASEKAVPQLELFMVSAYLQAGKTEEAKKAAQSIIDAYSKDENPMLQQVAMQAADLLKKTELLGTEIDLKFTALDGKEIDLKNYRGKVVLVDFWATWCGPCRAELPNVLKAYAAYHDKGFEIIGISFDRAQDKEKLQQFLVDQKMTWPQYFDGKFWQNDIGAKFGIRGIPATFLVGKDGKIARLDLRGEALSKAVAELLSK